MSDQKLKSENKRENSAESEPKYAGSILVIDDELSIRKSLEGILKRHNYQVETAESYEVIKDRLFTANFDALILDIILPDVDGIDILHIINKGKLNLPTIMLTGAPSLETAQESVKYGAFDYLTKPVEPILLLNQLKNAVHKKHLIDSRNDLLNKLETKNEELEQLVEQRTEELKISEIRYRTVVESVHDMIVLLSPDGKIKFSNVVFIDEISEAVGEDLHFQDIMDKDIKEYITSLNDMELDEAIKNVSQGHEYDSLLLKFSPKLKLKKGGEFQASVRGIFNEDLEIQEIIITIVEK